MAQPDNFSLYQPLVAGGAVDGRARPPRARRGRSSLAGLLAGLATLSRNDGAARPARRSGSSFALGPLARLALGGGRASPAIPFAAAVGVRRRCSCWSWRRGGSRQLAVFGSLSPSTASGKVLFIRDIGEWNSITTPATLDHLLGMGIGPLLATPDRRARRRRDHLHRRSSPAFVLAPFMVIGGWARRRSTDFGPFFALRRAPVRVLARSSRRSTCRAGRSSTRRSRSRRTPTSSRSRGSRSPSPGSPRGGRPGTRPRRRAVFVGAVVGLRRRRAPSSASLVVHADWDGQRERACRPSPTALDRPGAPPTRPRDVDRRVRRPQYWTGHGGVVLVNDPLETIERGRRAPTTSAGSSSTASDSVAAVDADPRRRPAAGLGRARRSMTDDGGRPGLPARPSTRVAAAPAVR